MNMLAWIQTPAYINHVLFPAPIISFMEKSLSMLSGIYAAATA
jgi:hypothetical protein